MQTSVFSPSRSELKNKILNYLKVQGYDVAHSAKLMGKSGIEHTFDLIAQADDFLFSYKIAICIAAESDRDNLEDLIFNFANQAYDAGIAQKILVTVPELGKKVASLAQRWRIRILDTDQIQSLSSLLDTKRVATRTREQVKIESQEQLVKSLAKYGYKVEENARVQGRSGVEYSFDILAYHDLHHFGYSLGIDFLTGNPEVRLEQVSLFDAKTFDTGIDHKVIIVKPALSIEARQFTEQQHIAVFELDKQLAAEPKPKSVAAELSPKTPPGKANKLSPQPEALQLIPEVMARRYNAIPIALSNGNTLEIAMVDPMNIFALEAFTALSRKRIKPFAASPKEVREAIDFNYKGYSEIEQQIAHISASTGAADEKATVDVATYTPLVQAVSMIIEEAAKARASDIHFEPEENRLRVRYRIDGTLQDMISLPLGIHKAMISRLKILADMNIADSHRPQDGQFTTTTKGRQMDIRVATTPTVYGEMAVLRLLDKSMAIMELSELGFLPESLARYENMLKVPYGMILIGGPTGSGKTTTLYASVNTLDSMKRNIITIEDPAEYRLKDINQIQVNPQAGLTFATGLRSILRLDPDVILIGEIRDGETATIAVQSALTGHMMLSSIHASDSTGVLSRLIDLGVEPFLIASAMIGIVSQRMVRRLCPDCQHTIEAPVLEQIAYQRETNEKRTHFPYGTGCKTCSYTGYRGRVGIYEVLAMTDTIKTMLYNRASSNAMRDQALKEGRVTMLNDGMNKVKLGITTPSEVVRAAYTTTS